FRERKQSISQTAEQLENPLAVRPRAAAELGELCVGTHNAARHQFAQALGVSQVDDTNPPSGNLVFVRGADPASSRAKRLTVRTLAVDQLVVRQHEVRSVAHIQTALDVDAVGDETV